MKQKARGGKMRSAHGSVARPGTGWWSALSRKGDDDVM